MDTLRNLQRKGGGGGRWKRGIRMGSRAIALSRDPHEGNTGKSKLEGKSQELLAQCSYCSVLGGGGKTAGGSAKD